MKKKIAVKTWSRKKIFWRSIISFAIFFLLIIAGVAGFKWLMQQPRLHGTNLILRKGLNTNEKINNLIYSEKSLAKTYPIARATGALRLNGNIGMPPAMPDTATWRLHVITTFNKNAKDSALLISLQDIKRLPKTQYVFEFKCIEGWTQITWWGGVKLSDFMQYYHLGTNDGKPVQAGKNNTANYAGFTSIDGKYYIGLDMLSALHPQTILCYEMNGNPLPFNQGAPLRLMVPVKYGIKSIKWIGTMYFSNTRPKDYWFERGYDYDAAL